MVVCIAEKPSVARDIARIIGANQSKNGYIEGNGYRVTWTFGHLCELKSPDEYNELWKRWSLAALPMIPNRFAIRLKEDEGIKKQFKIIEQIMSEADEIINCGDAGQEGELIQRWVMQKAKVKCPVKRLWISSMTDEAIREGFRNLKPQSDYDKLYMAGLSRAVGDWLLGMNCTRLYTLKYRDNSARYGEGKVLSIGRVQTPTLALVVRRQKEIDKFKPEPYWILSTVYRDTTFLATKGKFNEKQEAEQALEAVKNQEFEITSVKAKDGTEGPPKLYDLTSLQVDCNKKFGLSAETTLQVIQSLYEKKFTTYPRVDTTYLPDDVYPKCPNILKGLRGYEALTNPIANTKLQKRKKVFDSSKVTDHHAIIPTGQPANSLTDLEWKVYDLVVRAFIAAFYPDCKFKTTTVLGKAADVEFKATGKVIIQPGWKVVYPKTTNVEKQDNNNQEEDKEQTLPDFQVGEKGPHKPQIVEKMTQPPAYYTEATLLRAMETAGKAVEDEELREALKENGIGRPSTRAAIIETLFKRDYIRRDRKRILATPKGISLIDVIKEELLKSAELTGIWEKKLRDIEKGNYEATAFIDELKKMVTDIVHAVIADNSRMIFDNGDANPSQATKRTKPKNTPPSTTNANNVPAGFQPQKKKKATAVKSLKSQNIPNPQKSQNMPNPQNTSTLLQDEWIGLPCPLCGQGTIIKGKTAYGCSRWREGCQYRMPFQ